jgi:hypothetical protein
MMATRAAISQGSRDIDNMNILKIERCCRRNATSVFVEVLIRIRSAGANIAIDPSRLKTPG